MSLARSQGRNRLELPEALRSQLDDFRRRVWTVKMAEAACAAALVVAVAFLAMFGLDRVWDTPGWPRLGLFALAALGGAAVPLSLHRWVWRNRRPDQLARLLGRTHPHVGDQLLGVIELVRSDSEQARSRELCEAAVAQVADDARRRDFRAAVPNPRHRLLAKLLILPAAAVVGLFAFVPAAATNALARLAAPWRATPRYTFAALEPLPATLVVAHGEPFAVAVRLEGGTAWRPGKGEARLGGQPPVAAALRDGRYEFQLPAQIDPAWLRVRIGDAWQRVRVEPTLRPELTSVFADVSLPGYLGRPGALRKDARGGAVALVKGSRASFAATASRALTDARVDGQSRRLVGATVTSPVVEVNGPRTVEFRWKDLFGLAGKEPFTVAVTGRDDEAPSLACENMPRHKVLLDTEQVAFKVAARDDFGVKKVGLEWQGLDKTTVKNPAAGESVLAAGGNDKDALDVSGTFTAKSLGIAPQPVGVRVYVEDYFPGRGRVYSPTYTFYVLDPEQHAIWVTEQLSKWHRQSLEVRDREMQLFTTNKQLRALPGEELDRPDSRRRVENQAAAERANGRRLSGLVVSGEDLVKQAARNPEIGVGHLEKWAEMLQVLKDISGTRMPSVADLLKDAAQAPGKLAGGPAGKKAPMAGTVRDARAGSGAADEPKKGAAPAAVPQVADRESSQASPPDKPDGPPPPKNPSSPRLTLPVTTVMGKGSSGGPPPPPAAEKLDEALAKQQDLLAEFDKIAEELNRVLANLEGSTLVKRLKAASRAQLTVAGRISDHLGDTFGLPESRFADASARKLVELSGQEVKGSHAVSDIMDDMQAYFERRNYAQFRVVLDEMRKLDVVGSLRQLGDDLKKEHGMSIAQCEFWSDTLDRWADDLVDPVSGGT